MTRLFILSLTVLDAQLRMSLKRNRDFGKHGFIGHTITGQVLALSLLN